MQIINILFQVICTSVAALVLRRHLMVWKIFAPHFIFEAVGFMVTCGSILLGYLFVHRVISSLTNWSLNLQQKVSWFLNIVLTLIPSQELYCSAIINRLIWLNEFLRKYFVVLWKVAAEYGINLDFLKVFIIYKRNCRIPYI